MIFASPKNKKMVAPPAAPTTEAPSPVEQTLREAAAWEPDYSPPADFAAFTRRALEKHPRTPFPPPSSRPVPTALWGRGVRAPLAASLALGLVLWVGNSVNDLSVPNRTSGTAHEAARPVLGEKNTDPIRGLRAAKKSGPLVQPAEKAHRAAWPIATDTVRASRLQYALTSHRAAVRRHKSRDAWDVEAGRAGNLLAAHGAKQTNPAPMWKSETVERPAWGALIPATFACTTPASNDAGQESSENETTLMPVVLDVALPETGNIAAASSTSAPPSMP